MAPDSQSRPGATVGFVVDSTLPYPTSLSTCRKAIFSLVAVALIFLARINVRESEADMLNYRPPPTVAE